MKTKEQGHRINAPSEKLFTKQKIVVL